MAEDYTPTTEQVRFAFIDREDFDAQVGGAERPTDDESGAAFDRWLAFERAQALGDAADESERLGTNAHQWLRDRAARVERGEEWTWTADTTS